VTIIQLPLDQNTIDRARHAASTRDKTLEDLITEWVEQLAMPKSNPIVGLFRDDADLIDEITEDIMKDRENKPLRLTDEKMPD